MTKQIIDEQNIEIIIVGARNRDPATYSFIKDTINKLHKQQIKIVFCPAMESSINIGFHKQSLEYSIPCNQKSIDENYKQFCTVREDLKLPFFTLKDQYQLKQYLKNIGLSAPKQMIDMALQSVIRTENFKQNLLLLNLLEELNIPYKGIDDSGSIPALNDQTEYKRVFEMARHIIGDGVDALEGDSGIVICDVCDMYLPKLTAMSQIFTLIKDILNITSIIKDDIKIEIKSVFAHSFYIEDELEPIKEMLKQLANNDPQYLQNWYKDHLIKDIPFAENSLTGDFYSDEWNNLVGEVISFVTSHS